MAICDEEAALQAINSFTSSDRLSVEQRESKAQIDSIVQSDEPFINLFTLFRHYNILYFRGLLVPRIEVSWSPKLTLCAGICELVRHPNNGNKYTRIRLKLSEPLLKYRPRSDVIDTLLHESIHAYFFVTTDWKHVRGNDGTGHGEGFLLLADAINSHGGYGISVHHLFHDEVDSYRTHVWQCNGVCKEQAPFFGLVKRGMNRAPSKNDSWWPEHQRNCGGLFTKIADPGPTRDQVQRMSRLERAGRQKNKIDSWMIQATGQSRSITQAAVNGNENSPSTANSDDHGGDTTRNDQLESSSTVPCPICTRTIELATINIHLDEEHNP